MSKNGSKFIETWIFLLNCVSMQVNFKKMLKIRVFETAGFGQISTLGPTVQSGPRSTIFGNFSVVWEIIGIEMWSRASWKRIIMINMKKWQSPNYLSKWGVGTKNKKMLICVSTMYKWPIHTIETSYKVKNTWLLWPRVKLRIKSKCSLFFSIFAVFGVKMVKKMHFLLIW